MRFIFGVLVGYSMRGKEKSVIIILATIAFIVYILVPTVVLSVALLALSLDVHHERRSRTVLTKVPPIKGLSFEEAGCQHNSLRWKALRGERNPTLRQMLGRKKHSYFVPN